MGAKTVELQGRGAVGVVYIHQGERIHEGIVTTTGARPTDQLEAQARDPGGQHLAPRRCTAAGGDRRGRRARHAADRAGRGLPPIPVVVAEVRGQIEPERFVLMHGTWTSGTSAWATTPPATPPCWRSPARCSPPRRLARSVRIGWWSGHSHGRYAGSTWYAEAFALDLERNCICHVNCDSPGCRDADAYEGVHWMAEVGEFARTAIEDLTGRPGAGPRRSAAATSRSTTWASRRSSCSRRTCPRPSSPRAGTTRSAVAVATSSGTTRATRWRSPTRRAAARHAAVRRLGAARG